MPWSKATHPPPNLTADSSQEVASLAAYVLSTPESAAVRRPVSTTATILTDMSGQAARS
jgi:hypothetical protein